MTRLLRIAVPFLIPLIFSCTSSQENEALQHFVIKIESKYKRGADRNDIDLHFQAPDSRHVLIVLTYKTLDDKSQAESIGDAAIDLVKRLSKEDPEVRNLSFEVEKSVRQRD